MFAKLVVANSFDSVRRSVQMGVWQKQYGHSATHFNINELLALLVHQIGANRNGNFGNYPAGPLLDSFLVDESQHRDRQRFHGADHASAFTARAPLKDRLA